MGKGTSDLRASYVTDDGIETDLDLGHYERFIDENLDKNSNVTTGKVYWTVLQKERRGDFGGGTVQVIPHITNAIKEKIYNSPEAYGDVAALQEYNELSNKTVYIDDISFYTDLSKLVKSRAKKWKGQVFE